MLHIGWRQAEPAINAKRSIPMHLFAGENLLANYQQQLQQFEQEQKQSLQQENTLQTMVDLAQEQSATISEAENKRRLENIITSLDLSLIHI